MSHTYLRYSLRDTFGVITSPESNAVLTSHGKLAVAGALEDIVIWNLKQGVQTARLKGPQGGGVVTVLATTPLDGSSQLASGHSDGTIRLWNLHGADDSTEAVTTLSGHTAAVSAVAFNRIGSLLASGSFDTDIVVWDVVAEAGLYKLRGHKDAITGCLFLERSQRLVTSSKDTLVKVWDHETQHCVQTCVGHRNEVWSLDVNATETRVVTGSADNKLRVYDLPTSEEGDAASGGDGESKDGGGASDEVLRSMYVFLVMLTLCRLHMCRFVILHILECVPTCAYVCPRVPARAHTCPHVPPMAAGVCVWPNTWQLVLMCRDVKDVFDLKLRTTFWLNDDAPLVDDFPHSTLRHTHARTRTVPH